MAILVQNHGLTTLEKRQFFDVLNFLVYIAYKTHFLAHIAQKKKFQKWPIFDQNHGLTPFENFQRS